MRTWNYVETREEGPFTIILDWTYEDMALRDAFDEEDHDLAAMIERCNNDIDTHYIARVRCFYHNKEMASKSLSSCYAYDCAPDDDMKEGIGGYLDDMINTVLEEASTEAETMLTRLREDFFES